MSTGQTVTPTAKVTAKSWASFWGSVKKALAPVVKALAPVVATVSNHTPTMAPTQTEQSATGVIKGLLNGSDADGDPLTYSVVTNPAHGSVIVLPNGGTGIYSYTPNRAYAHNLTWPVADTFTVAVSDESAGPHIHWGGGGHQATKTITVYVYPQNVAPKTVAHVDGFNKSNGVVNGGIYASDDDYGDLLSYSVSVPPSKGTAVMTVNGYYTYTPTAAARHNAGNSTPGVEVARDDTFTVTVSDGHGGNTRVNVTVPISPANTAPTGIATVDSPDADTGVATGSVTATDAENDPLTYYDARAAHGTVVVAANGVITYTPTPAARHRAASLTATDADKTDTISVTVYDGHADSDGYAGVTRVSATVTISPSNTGPAATANVGAPDATSGVVAGAILGTDPENDALSYSAPDATAKGTVTLAADGTFTYTPTAEARQNARLNSDFPGATTDTFTITLSDGHGGTVDVQVPVTIAPDVVQFQP
ncbi:MAG: Ig-like domain-containing protein [Mycobacteriaceae bacterium]